jgi:hypothetical protein
MGEGANPSFIGSGVRKYEPLTRFGLGGPEPMETDNDNDESTSV